MEQPPKKLWQSPWLYRESALMVAGLAAIGFALQLTAGHFNFYLLHYPVNIGVAVALTLFLALCAFAGRSMPLRWLSGTPLAVSLLAALLAFGLIMGLVPQAARLDPHAHSLFQDLGFTRVTSSWPFVLLYAATLLSLGMVAARRIRTFGKKDAPFLCNHLGLWILLLAAGLGAADMQRFVMHVREGEVEWRVYSAGGEALELPIAIRLHDFFMEEYPPRLVLIDRESGRAQPEGNPWLLAMDPKRPSGRLGDWEVNIEEYIHEAVRSEEGYRHSPMPASTPAARVRAVNARTGETRTGWVSGGGNIPGFFAALAMDDSLTMVMTEPEPKRFASDITVMTKSGTRERALLEVNSPLSVDGWMIYQYGYDVRAGKMSTYSSMELVHDAWLLPALFGMLLMLAGCAWLVWNGTGKNAGTRRVRS